MPDKQPIPTLDQQRAVHALACVQRVEGAGFKTEYRAYVRSLPLLLTMNGLGQTLALELAGASRSGNIGDGHAALLSHILLWLAGGDNGWKTSPYLTVRFAIPNGPNNDDEVKKKAVALITAIMHENERDMLRAQQELMAYVKWLKTFAEALIAPPEQGEA
ncbi:CRISPR type III-B/RAMP module-associated protein Cmr5 [Rhodobium orientis]|nr:type III-B CRISPR module-associated protein Cmr5 [Rhodobium orientis]MBB4302849.1 CRISPR type III-B/RAMP module-associated protein Cmr5 [Rhodobium orientis]